MKWFCWICQLPWLPFLPDHKWKVIYIRGSDCHHYEETHLSCKWCGLSEVHRKHVRVYVEIKKRTSLPLCGFLREGMLPTIDPVILPPGTYPRSIFEGEEGFSV